VLVIQVMGRKIGYIPAAARLADPRRELPLQIYMVESGLSLEALADNVNDQLKKDGRCIVVLSEGFDVGDIGETKDSFGHTQFGASSLTAQQAVVSHLNEKGLPVPGKARGQVHGTDQRSSTALASDVDLEEAYRVGAKAVDVAMNDGNGWMATMLRKAGEDYEVYYDKVPLQDVANSERTFPAEWLAPSRVDVTDDFVRYARPLIGDQWVEVPLEDGLPRYARFQPVFAEKKCAGYVPQALR
jgi:6-phosphofructokinase 1